MRTHAHSLQLGSGIVLFTYLFLHLFNHALGIWSIELANHALKLAMRLWQSAPGTILLYGAAGLHFGLALRTLYGRRHWALSPAEWIRLWAGLSLPLLLIRHAVGTRIAVSFYGFEPNYERVVISLITSGTRGLQMALLAPGWVHGCMGLWFRLRRYAPARRAKPVLAAVFVGLPLLSAVGFIRMTRAVEAANAAGMMPDAKLVAHRLALAAWQHNLVTVYLSLIVGAVVAGRLHHWLERSGRLVIQRRLPPPNR